MVEFRRRVIVCLGQSLLADGQIPQALQRRLAHAAEVYKRLSQEEGGACIYVSGADPAGDGALQPEGDAMAHQLQSRYGIDESDIDRDVQAWDTIGNAANAIAPIRRRAAKEVVLVTSDFHAPRAAFVFKTVFAAMSATGLVLSVDTVPSQLPICPPRPEGERPFEINEWNMLERLDHETTLMEGMVGQLQREGFIARQEDCSEALAALIRLTAESKAALVASRASCSIPEVGTASDCIAPTGPPPLACDRCGRGFGSSTLLTMHRRRCGPQEPEAPESAVALEPYEKRIFLLRHGQGEHNVWSHWDSPDPPLTALGFEQANSWAAEMPKIVQPEVVLLSPLTRTLQTGLRAFQNCSTHFEVCRHARERPFHDKCNLLNRDLTVVRRLLESEPRGPEILTLDGKKSHTGIPGTGGLQEGFTELPETDWDSTLHGKADESRWLADLDRVQYASLQFLVEELCQREETTIAVSAHYETIRTIMLPQVVFTDNCELVEAVLNTQTRQMTGVKTYECPLAMY